MDNPVTTAGDPPDQGQRVPAPGEAATRLPATEQAYIKRALSLQVRAGRMLSIEEPSPVDVANYYLMMREELSKSTWRQYKASLICRYGSMGTADSLVAVNMLRDGHQTICAARTNRTSGRRAKKVSEPALEAVLSRVRASKSKYGPVLFTWLLLGREIGLRPHEWGLAQVIEALPQQVGDISTTSLRPLPYLKVRNAKRTNGRGHGDFRHLNLKDLKPGLVHQVKLFAESMRELVARGQYAQCYSGCQQLLYRINRSLHRSNEAKWVQLYSPRHSFSANAKQELGQDGVAALMGHATTKTAGEHYGRRVSANGSLGPKPVAAEIARVRKVRSYRARTQAPRTPAAIPAPAKSGD